MTLLLFFLLQIDIQDVFIPISKRLSAVAPNGDLYVSLIEDGKIGQYHQSSGKVRFIGRKGQGPGEFDPSPGELSIVAGELTVGHGIFKSVFNLEGEFQYRVSLPDGNMYYILKKTAGGWVGHVATNFSTETVQLTWFSNDLAQKQVLYEMANETPNAMASMGSDKIPYNPVINAPEVQVTPDGKYAFFRAFNDFAIFIFNMETRELEHQILQDVPNIRFNDAWGKKMLEREKAQYKDMPFMRVVPDFPDSFPAIKRMGITPEGFLAVFTWTQSPENPALICFDHIGNTVNSVVFTEESYERCLGMAGTQIIVSYFPDEEAKVALVSPEKLEQFLSDHPVEFDFLEYLASKRR